MKKLILIFALTLIICLSITSVSNAFYYVWTDTVGDGEKDLLLGSISAYTGTLTGKNNYDYYSKSGHPVNGPNPQSHRLKIFIYERTTNGHAFLNIIGGADEEGHNHWHSFSLDFDIIGSTLDPHKTKGDEGKEFKETSEDLFEGDWNFRKNSDGGVIGGLMGDWEAKITFLDSDLNKYVFASSGSSNIHIDEYLFGDDFGYDTYFISYTDQLPVVPEPMTMLLFSGGLAGMFLRRRRVS